MKQRPKKSRPGRRPEGNNPPGKVGGGEPAPPPSPGRKRLFRLIALVVLPLLLLGGLEAGLRLAGYGHAAGFFKEIRVGEKAYLVDNENFSLRFFPPQLARWPGPVMMEAKKPANTYRIFILGESAARGEPEPNYAASRYLQTLLNERYPATRFEVVNLGITAINSHVILPIARDCAKAGGDLWIIYMGNNEMVGPFGAATVFGAKAPPLGIVRLNLAIQKTRTGQLLADISRRLKGKSPNDSWGGMNMFAGNELRADDPRKAVVYQNFERNLNDIVKAGLNSGAKILLNTVAVNLKDCPPFASLTNARLTAAERTQFDQLLAEAGAEEAQSNFVGAVHTFEQAAKVDPLFSGLHYGWGESLLALTNYAGAREQFQTACDVDALPFRADTRINGAIQKIGKQFAGDRLAFFDAASALGKNLPAGVCGRETFFEHVHFNFDGNYRLGQAWAEQVAKMLPDTITRDAGTNDWAMRETCDRLLGLTDWNRCRLTELFMDRLGRPPLSGQANSAERLRLLRAETLKLRRQMNPDMAAQAAEIYQAAIQHSPQDPLLRENYADFLESVRDLKGAAEQWRQEQQLVPHDWEPFFQLGRLLAELKQWDEAEVNLTTALTLRPRLAEGWSELGGIHLAAGNSELALQDYSQARQLDPQNTGYLAETGRVLAKLNRHAEAMEQYREAIRLQPDLWQAHFALAGELMALNQIEAAKNELGEAARLNSNAVQVHFNYAVLLAKQGQLDEAQREFETVLRLEPAYPSGQEYLARVLAMKQRPR